MQIEIQIDKTCTEPKLIIVADKMTDEITEIVKKISEQPLPILAGFEQDQVVLLDPTTIIRIYAANQKVYVLTDSGEYIVKLRIYEMEQRLDTARFVRISSSEIINLKKVKGFDLSLSGTICVIFQNGSTSYVSRRYVVKIKKVLGL